MNRRIAIAAVVAAAALLVPSPRPVAALVDTNTLTVQANVRAVCSVAPATMTFPDYDPAATTPTDAPVVNITVRCSYGTAYTLDLDQGVHPSGTTRRMAGGSAAFPGALAYDLFSDSSHSTPWANGLARAATTPGVAASDYTIPVYGRISPGQIVSPGAYQDTVTLTVNF